MSRLSEPMKQAVERLFTTYRLNQARAALLMARLERAGGSIIPRTPKGLPQYEENLAALADITSELDKYEAVLMALNHRERLFVRLRYDEELSIPAVARKLGICERSAYRLRDRVLAKAAAVLGWQENVSSFDKKPAI